MFFKRKVRLLIIVMAVIAALITAFVLIKREPAAEISGKIGDYGLSTCTLDIPTSSCGNYSVTVVSESKTATYTVEGFEDRQRKRYDDITSKIREAKEQNRSVQLKVNHDGVITSVELVVFLP